MNYNGLKLNCWKLFSFFILYMCHITALCHFFRLPFRRLTYK